MCILFCFPTEQKREQRLEVQSSFPRTLLHAGRTFVMGVVLGLSGVVVKPVAGELIHNNMIHKIVINYVYLYT